MSNFEQACQVISEAGAHANHLYFSGDEYDHQDREQRVHLATGLLMDWVAETFADSTDDGKLPFDRKYVGRIASMIARGMLWQYEHHEKLNGEIIAEMANEGCCAHHVELPRQSISPAAAERLRDWLGHLEDWLDSLVVKEGGAV